MQNTKLLFDVTFYTEDCVLHFVHSFYELFKTFFQFLTSNPEFITLYLESEEFTSEIGDAMQELPLILKEVEIHPQFWKFKKDFMGKVRELTSDLLKGNQALHPQFQK